MDIYNYFISEKNKLIEKISNEKKYIGSEKEKYITFHIKKNVVDAYLNEKDKKPRYVRRAEYRTYIKEIKIAYYVKQLRFDQMYLKAVDAFLKNYNPNIKKAEMIIKNSEDLARLLFPNINTLSKKLAVWFEENYDSNPPFPEKRIIKTIHGEKVRSKSECMIADSMYMKGVPYRYEFAMEIDDIMIYPDFTIMHPKTGEIIIWEHLGKADDQQYLLNNIKKMALYAKAGFIVGKNLIITTESQNYPLDSDTVNSVIEKYFVR